MARNRRRFVKGETYFITCRVKEGLPFVPNEYIRLIIGGVLARAQELYPEVKVVASFVMGNHYHMIIYCAGNPPQISDFFQYLNGQLSSIFHRLTGVAHDNFWADRFKCQPLLTAESIIDKIAYLYLNAVKANLIDEVRYWEGFSSWGQFVDGKIRDYRWATEAHVSQLPKGNFYNGQLKELIESFKENSRAERPFNLSPYIWTREFAETRYLSDETIKDRIIFLVQEGEKKYRAKRVAQKKRVVGVSCLRYQSIYKQYVSKDYRKTPLAISSCVETLNYYKIVYWNFCELCKRAWRALKTGSFDSPFPPGAFLPRSTPLSSIWFSP